MQNRRLTALIQIILVGVLIVISVLYLLRLISDPDFFWHLKTGEWIWQNKALPTEDPFNYTTPRTHSMLKQIILTSYWLSQIIYYLIYAAGGMSGIILLRFVIVGALAYGMFKREYGDKTLYICLMIIFFTLLLQQYPIERPHVFSFLFFGFLLSLLERTGTYDREREISVTSKAASKDYSHLTIPFLMIIWVNMHGGYVLGQITIIVYIVMEGIKFSHPSLQPMTKDAYKRLLIAGLSGIAISLLNPNTYHGLPELMKIPTLMAYGNVEYSSSLTVFRRMDSLSILLYWGTLFITVIGLLMTIRRPDITQIALLVGTGIFSFYQIRYIPFFMVAALPVAGRSVSSTRLLKFGRVVMVVLALFVAVFFARHDRSNYRNLISGEWINGYFLPVKAADFILANDLQGNMYNHYNWGGYLIWRLGPDRKVFVDGRNMSYDIFAASSLVSAALKKDMAGLPFWKSTLNAYGVRYIGIPLFIPSGQLVTLVNALLNDKEWIPVFFKLNSLIFVKDSPENYHVIRKYSIPKDYFREDLVEVCNRLIKSNPRSSHPYIAKGDLYLSMNRFKEAKEAYENVLKFAPFNETARERIKYLDRKR
ncbi:MAG: hypothetical protein HZA17_11020 [Nitrospirae bacterium]|nr:hypothetical protein [Nitrospirota bacterium]